MKFAVIGESAWIMAACRSRTRANRMEGAEGWTVSGEVERSDDVPSPGGSVQRWGSATAGSGSDVRTDAGGRRLQTFDTNGGPLLHIPSWSAGRGNTREGAEETSGDAPLHRRTVPA